MTTTGQTAAVAPPPVVSDAELPELLLSAEDVGAEFPGVKRTAGSVRLTVGQVALGTRGLETLDDQMIQLFGWLSGFALAVDRPGPVTKEGVFRVETRIERFRNERFAVEYVKFRAEDYLEHKGDLRAGGRLIEVEYYSEAGITALGKDAQGVVLQYEDKLGVYFSNVIFMRKGTLIGTVSISRVGLDDSRTAAALLAAVLSERMGTALEL